MLEDNKADDSLSPGALFERSVAMANNLGVKEHSEAPLIEEPQESAYIEGASGYGSTAIMNEPNVELHGVSVVESTPDLGGVTQGEHDMTCDIQLESLDTLVNERAEAVNPLIGT